MKWLGRATSDGAYLLALDVGGCSRARLSSGKVLRKTCSLITSRPNSSFGGV